MFRSPQVVLFSADVSRAAAFYEALGFTETRRVPVDGEPIHIDLTLDGYKLGLASIESTRDDHRLQPVVEGQRLPWSSGRTTSAPLTPASWSPRSRLRTNGWAC